MKIAIVIEAAAGAGYRAECPSLPGCTAFGRSPEEARQQITRAILGYLASLDTPAPAALELDVPELPRRMPRWQPPAGSRRVASVA
jgi:predicted RNase H-like HicB family nuclease